MAQRQPTVVLDVDGTLVDSNYLHVVCWARAFAQVGVTVPHWRIHRAIGKGGDKLVAAVAGDDVERDHGDEVRDRWEQEYDAVIDQVAVLPGAQDLLAALDERGVAVALASSSIPQHAERAFELLDAEQYADAATTAEDAEESKPDPELIETVLERVGADAGCVVGDSVWDVEAAQRAALPAYGVLTGGVGRQELMDAGAAGVYEDVAEMLDHVDEWLPSDTP